MRTPAEMTAVRRLVTYVDIADEDPASAKRVSVVCRLDAELNDGRRVLLLDDRGWSSTAYWSERSAAYIRDTSRMVVGPDGPPGGRSEEEEAALYWTYLQQIAQRQGIAVDAGELEKLPHDVALSPRLLARIADNDPSSASYL